MNGATCQATGDGSSYICNCPSGYTGNNCTTTIATNISTTTIPTTIIPTTIISTTIIPTTTIPTMTQKTSTTSPLQWNFFGCTAKCATGEITLIPDTSPSWNGCGKEEGYDFSKLLPKNLLPGFTLCCNDHDICYNDCSKTKSVCEKTFYTCLKTAVSDSRENKISKI